MNANENKEQKMLPQLLIAWLWVGIPLVWGISQTFIKALALFK